MMPAPCRVTAPSLLWSDRGLITQKELKFLASECMTELLESSDITLFKAALKNPDHVIHPLLPPPKLFSYTLRKRSHGLLLPTTQSNLCKNFVYRMLFKDIY